MDALAILFEDALLEEYEETMEVSSDVNTASSSLEDSSTLVLTSGVITSEPIVELESVPTTVLEEVPTEPTVLPLEPKELINETGVPVVSLDLKLHPSVDGRPNRRTVSCTLCQKPHRLRACFSFRRLEHAKKLRHVLMWKHCSRCLATNHTVKECRSLKKCAQCQGDHNVLLHSPSRGMKSNEKSGRKPNEPAPSRSRPPIVAPLPLRHVVTFSLTLLLKLCVGSRDVQVRAVLDLCSSISYISDQLSGRLRLPVAQSCCRITVRSLYDRSKCISLTAQVKRMHGIRTPKEDASETVVECFPGMQLADPTFYRAGTVALVLGPEVSGQILTGKVFSNPGSPLAQYTIFGWIVSGQSPI